ncbi:MAG: PIG-L family deacetylase [Lentisphaeria bacterium]|nr:PIG-L family deacetylase [Lentisphaeria bacterium]
MSYKVLIVGAHHEEVEAEFPNIAATLASTGCEVHILNPIGGWNWTFIRNLEGDGRAKTVADAKAAAAELGCTKTIWDYPVAQCDRFQAEIMDRMAEFLIDFAPDIVLMHWPLDSHADHRLVAHITHQVLLSATDMVKETRPEFRYPREIYAFQTGVAQVYHFIPDCFVLCDGDSMAKADRAIACFSPTASDCTRRWKQNFHTKAACWSNLAGAPAEALKFLGPELPLDGFLLKKILGEKLISSKMEPFYFNRDFQL